MGGSKEGQGVSQGRMGRGKEGLAGSQGGAGRSEEGKRGDETDQGGNATRKKGNTTGENGSIDSQKRDTTSRRSSQSSGGEGRRAVGGSGNCQRASWRISAEDSIRYDQTVATAAVQKHVAIAQPCKYAKDVQKTLRNCARTTLLAESGPGNQEDWSAR